MSFNKILIINPYGIGDVLFTTPLVSNLRLQFPRASIVYLANRRTASFLDKNTDIAKVLIYERDEFVAVYQQHPLKFVQKWLSFYQLIKNEGFDLVVDFSLNSTFGFLCAACGIKKRIGFDYQGRGRFLTDRLPLKGFEDKHVVEYYLDLLQLIDVPVKIKTMRLDVPNEDRQWAVTWFVGHQVDTHRPLIAVMPGGGQSWGKAAVNKRWPAAQYAELVDKIIENFDAAVILMGDPKDEEICRTIVQLGHFPLYVAVGQTSITGLSALLKSCRVAIVNDGGPLHIAVASGIQTVSIFGPVDPMVYGPYPGENHQVVQKKLACQPCYRRFRQARCNHINCLKTLSVEEVYRKVQKVL